jgi:FlaG/FlaF family flagellin (archaellin)
MRSDNKKGVSPVIATTILIGFAVVVTSIVMLFGGDLLEDIQKKQGITMEQTLQCDSMHFKVTNILQGNRLQITNDGKADINAFLIRYIGDAESIEPHHKVHIPQGGVGEIIISGAPGIGEIKSAKIFAKSAAGPKGKAIWGTCGQTETTVKLNNA